MSTIHMLAEIQHLRSEVERLRKAFATENHEIEQILGKALGYPPLYPDASPVDDGTVGVGEHVPATLAMDAAERIGKLTAEVERLRRERDAVIALCILIDGTGERWSFVGEFGPVPYRSLVKSYSQAEAIAAVRKAAGLDADEGSSLGDEMIAGMSRFCDVREAIEQGIREAKAGNLVPSPDLDADAGHDTARLDWIDSADDLALVKWRHGVKIFVGRASEADLYDSIRKAIDAARQSQTGPGRVEVRDDDGGIEA